LNDSNATAVCPPRECVGEGECGIVWGFAAWSPVLVVTLLRTSQWKKVLVMLKVCVTWEFAMTHLLGVVEHEKNAGV
jgi:hypothetical protein